MFFRASELKIFGPRLLEPSVVIACNAGVTAVRMTLLMMLQL